MREIDKQWKEIGETVKKEHLKPEVQLDPPSIMLGNPEEIFNLKPAVPTTAQLIDPARLRDMAERNVRTLRKDKTTSQETRKIVEEIFERQYASQNPNANGLFDTTTEQKRLD